MEKEIEMMKKRGLAELEALENRQKSQVKKDFISPLDTPDRSPTYRGDSFSESASYLALALSFIALLFAFYVVVYPTGKGKSEPGTIATAIPANIHKLEENLIDLNTFRKGIEEDLAKVNENLTHLNTVYQETTQQLNTLQPRLNSLNEVSNRLEVVRSQLARIQTQLDQIATDVHTEQLKSALLQAKWDIYTGTSPKVLQSHLQKIKSLAAQSHLPDREQVIQNLDTVMVRVNQGEDSVISKLENVLNQIDTAFEMK
jgi:archaellum component FlaC